MYSENISFTYVGPLILHLTILFQVSSVMTPGNLQDDKLAKFTLAHNCKPGFSARACCNFMYNDENLVPIYTNRYHQDFEGRIGMHSFDCLKLLPVPANAPRGTLPVRITRRTHFMICPAKSMINYIYYELGPNPELYQLTRGEEALDANCIGEEMNAQKLRPRDQFAFARLVLGFWYLKPICPQAVPQVYTVDQLQHIYPEFKEILQTIYRIR